MKQNDQVNKFKATDLNNGININIVDGREGKIVEINISGQKKKLPIEDVDNLIDALTNAKKWIIDRKL